jgi:hypothetical protein
MVLRKQQSHGKIGEAAVMAKCWMHGIPAYNIAGLRANFAGSDLIVDTADPAKKLLLQVKAGYSPSSEWVYMTQCTGEHDLTEDKFVSDFVVFVNLDKKIAEKHQHEGELDFKHLIFYVVPRPDANRLYRAAVKRDYERPLKKGGVRSLNYMAVNVPASEMAVFRDAWNLIRRAVITDALRTL